MTVFPSKEKFETKSVKDNWPTINEEFSFSLGVSEKRTGDILKGKFVSFTIYATLEETEEEKPAKSSRGVVKRFFSFDENSDFLRKNVHRSFSSRRSFR